MALRAPQDLCSNLNASILEIRSEKPLGAGDRTRIADDLTEVFNYLSTVSCKPSITNVLYAQSAQQAKLTAQAALERKLLQEHQRFVETYFDKAETHLKAIQLGGYAVFFGLLGLSGTHLNSVLGACAGLLMVISASAFIIWELYKASLFSRALKRHSSISSGRLEDFLKSRMDKLVRERAAVIVLAKSAPTAWGVSVGCALGAIAILMWQWLTIVGQGIGASFAW